MSPRCNTSPATDVLCARFSLSHPSSWLNFGVSYKVGDCNIWNGTAWIVVILCMLCVQTNECVPLNSPMFHGLPAEQPRPPTPQGQRTLLQSGSRWYSSISCTPSSFLHRYYTPTKQNTPPILTYIYVKFTQP